MSNGNLKEFSCLSCWREEGDFINEIDVKIFFKRRKQPRISEEFNFLIDAFAEADSNEICRD
jgi:hypothetical protein